MTATRAASIAALIGGLGWLVTVGLLWTIEGATTGEGLVRVMFVVGLLALVVALAASGYSLVATAPIWLRLVVSVAMPMLVFMVWQVADDAFQSTSSTDGSLHGAVTILLAAVVALALGARGLKGHRFGLVRTQVRAEGSAKGTDVGAVTLQ